MKILLPVDGSSASLAAVQHALACVRAGLRASFVVANVQEPASLYEVVVTHDATALDALRAAAGADLIREAEVLLEAAGQSFESEVAGGDPGHVLLDLIESYGCDAVIMGAAEDEFSGPVGAVARALLERSPVPVTLVRVSEVERAEAANDDAG